MRKRYWNWVYSGYKWGVIWTKGGIRNRGRVSIYEKESSVTGTQVKAQRGQTSVLQDVPLVSKASIAPACGGKGDDTDAETSGVAVDALSTAAKCRET